jgi:putative PIN family toxin of toxin-antitoxin system
MKSWLMRFRQWLKFGQRITPRVVADTNVLVSGSLVSVGAPARIIQAARDRRIALVSCPLLLAEYADVMGRPHIAKKYREAARVGQATLEFLRVKATLVAAIPQQRIVPDDPDDDVVIACAVEGKARYVVTGDPHLQRLGEHAGIRILSPRQFVTQVLHET